jgi:hypothetical protein
MKLELINEKAKNFPKIENPLDFNEIRIWYCNYRSLSLLSDFQNLENIEILGYPDSSLELIGRLSNVKYLRIMHMPRVNDLSPLSNLKLLERLELAVLFSWNRQQHIKSLQPLNKLSNLQIVELHGVYPDDGSLQSLLSCPLLSEFQSGNLFTMQELLNLKVAKPEIKGTFFQPFVELPYSICEKCGSKKVILSGVIKNAFQCPECNKERIEKHLALWEAYLSSTTN